MINCFSIAVLGAREREGMTFEGVQVAEVR